MNGRKGGDELIDDMLKASLLICIEVLFYLD